MKGWILIGVGALALVLGPWVLMRIVAELGRRFGSDDVPIAKPRYRYLNADEAIAVRTAKKRSVAEGSRKRAAQVDSGTPVSDLLRRVK